MLNCRKSVENTIAIIDTGNPGNHKSANNTFKITLGRLLSDLTNRPFRVPFCYFKACLSAKPFLSKDFHLHENETAWRTQFHMKGSAHRLVLKQRHKKTRKWPIDLIAEIAFVQVSLTCCLKLSSLLYSSVIVGIVDYSGAPVHRMRASSAPYLTKI